MTSAYFDTSVLVKNYVREAGSTRAGQLLRSHAFLSSSIIAVELISALMRRKSRQELAMRDIPEILARVREDRRHWQLVEVGAPVLDQAEQIIQTVQTRAFDAIHIASVLTFQFASGVRVPFITADRKQRDAAKMMNLDVIWIG